MKKLFIICLTLFLFIFDSCVSQIGSLNIISQRNIDMKENYELLASYQGGNKKKIKKTKCTTIEDAVNATVKDIPGGEFLMNAKIYRREGLFQFYYAVEGDVWGTKTDSGFHGFKIGDVVTWKYRKGYQTGQIKSYINNEKCLIELEDGTTVEKKFDEIIHK